MNPPAPRKMEKRKGIKLHRLARYDVVTSSPVGTLPIVAQLAFGAACTLAAIVLRVGLDLVAPNVGAFALVYPTVLIATLFGRWPAGMAAFFSSFFWAWWYVLPIARSFELQRPGDVGGIVINAVSVLIVLTLAEAFRRAVREAAKARDVEIERSTMLMAELEHRTKNNFALVASLLSLQARRHADPQVGVALEQAIGRIHTFAQAYEKLALAQGCDGMIAMREYVHGVASRTAAAMLPGEVAVVVEASDCLLPQQVAVAIGLFFNEALTNCAKYAFPEGRPGRISLGFHSDEDGWHAFVTDDGVGEKSPLPASRTGLGQNLMKAFAQQARAQYEYSAGPNGCHVSLRSEAVPCTPVPEDARPPDLSPA